MKFFQRAKEFFIKKVWNRVKKGEFASNLILGFLILSVSFACFYPLNESLETGSLENRIYRKGVSKDGVSLMFNVYSDTESVNAILTTLKENGAKATFFIGGCWADDNVACLKRIVEEGHELANHGYFHKDHPSLSLADNVTEISLCNRFLKESTGKEILLFAPPSGAYDEKTVNAAESLNMKTILWTRDTIDWRDKDASIVYSRATKNITAGEFVLMHPTPHTASALNDVLHYYKSCSLRMITVSENLQVGG